MDTEFIFPVIQQISSKANQNNIPGKSNDILGKSDNRMLATDPSGSPWNNIVTRDYTMGTPLANGDKYIKKLREIHKYGDKYIKMENMVTNT